MNVTFTAAVWRWQGEALAAWFFVTLPEDQSKLIKHLNGTPRRGFGSVRVKAKIGKTEWKTSLFPYSKANAYLLPIKADVRKREKISEGSRVRVDIEFVDTF